MPQTLRVTFPGHDKLMLDGRLELPDQAPSCHAVFAHCFTCSKDLLSTFRISKQLAARGIATLRFDFAGLGTSEGDFADTSFSTQIQDLLAACDFLSQQHQPPSLLIGHSLGGTAALAAAGQYESVRAVATIAAPGQPQHVLHHFGEALAALQAGRDASIEVAGVRYTVRPQFVQDVQGHDMQKTLATLHKPVLIFHVDGDTIVGPHNAEQIQQWCAGETRLYPLRGTDHVLSDRQSASVVSNAIADFAEQQGLC